MKKIVVTGGTGYIGSHTSVELINKGFEVIIIDNLSNSSIDVLDGIKAITGIKPEFHKIDLSDAQLTQDFFKSQNNIKGIIHFAAYKAVGESVACPLKYYHNNIFSLINLLRGMLENNIPNIVFSSSCTVYGEPQTLPVKETEPVKKAISPYGNTKQISEEIINDFITSNKNFKSILLRYFNPIGAHESGLIGELPIGVPNNLVPFITQTAIGKRAILNVFGNDYNTPDGTCIRDYIHVCDLAEAHVVALNRMLENKTKLNCEIFNLGTGHGYSVLEIINSFEKVTGIKLNYQIIERRQGDVEKVFADTELANQELGWKTHRSLDEMMLSAWIWEQNLLKKQNNIK